MPQEKSAIIKRMEDFLANAWEQEPEPSRYAAAVATQLLQFAAGAERAIRQLAERVKALETLLQGAAGEAQTAVAGEVQQPIPGASRVHQASSAGVRGMVRLGGDGTPLSPEEQAAEEAADMQFQGTIDESRYVPAGAAPKAPPSVTIGAPPPVAPPANGQG